MPGRDFQKYDFVRIKGGLSEQVPCGIVQEVDAVVWVVGFNGFEYRFTRDDLELIAPYPHPGTRLALYGETPIDPRALELVCAGTDPDMGYMCSKKPGHDGECWSSAKQCHFHDVERDYR